LAFLERSGTAHASKGIHYLQNGLYTRLRLPQIAVKFNILIFSIKHTYIATRQKKRNTEGRSCKNRR
jgi:hypothetical protein